MKTVKIKELDVGPSDKFMFDTNVWIYLFGPVANSNSKAQSAYSKLFQEISQRKATIFITSAIVSEFINVFLRNGFERWKRENQLYAANFKIDYRPTKHYQLELEDAKMNLLTILSASCVTRKPDNFHNADVESIFDLVDNDCDYNDALILKACEQDHIFLVSNDKDFLNQTSSVSIITM